MNSTTIGNKNLISSEEERIALFLKERNLDKVNAAGNDVIPADNFYIRYCKRILDILISVPAFIVTLPLNFIFGVCTFFDVGRPIFYKQTRVGKDGKPFIMVKFRNMNENKGPDGKLLPPHERITKFGKFMRKYSFDELLNFWSVVKGDMSIIGPRPLPVFFYERMSDRHKMRNAVKPGLECPRVIFVEGEQYQIQFENDVWYVENVSFLTDIKMCFLLLKMTLNFLNRDRAATGMASSYFVGYDDDCRAIYKELALQKYGEMMRNEESK